MKVIPNHNGFCEGVQFTKDVEIDLSPSILKALGKDAYTATEQPKAQKVKVEKPELEETKEEMEEKQIDETSNKQVTGAKNK